MEIIKSDIVSLHGAVVSMQGGRTENQDDYAFLDTPLGFLLVVCDGMGGGPGGKTASYIAKYEISKTLLDCNPQTPREHAFKMAVARAHERLEAKMDENPSLSGMGSTFVAVLVNQQSVIIAHAGDSRCYLLRGRRCLYRSNDHSLVAELVRKKVMTEEEARQSPQSNVITRGLGSTKNQVPEIEEIPYCKGDRFVLCTDGVWGMMPQKDLLDRLNAKSDIQTIVSNLSTAIDKMGFLHGGHHDNHTLAMFEVETSSKLKPQRNWKQIGLWVMASCVAIFVLALCIWGILWLTGRNTNKERTALSGSTSAYTVGTQSSARTTQDASATYSSQEGEHTKAEDIKEENESLKQNSDTKVSIGKDSLLNAIRKNKAKEDPEATSQKDTAKTISDAPKESSSALSSETVQKIINRYNKAKDVAEPSVGEANKKLEPLHQEIKSLVKDLAEQTQKSEVYSTVEAIGRAVDYPENWYVDKNPDATTKRYGLTASSKKSIDKLINKLTELKTKFQHK